MPRLGWILRATLSSFALLSFAVVALGQPVAPELVNGLKWRLIGPFRGGRVVAVAGVPGDSTTFYFGGVNGGIWKTNDSGVTWSPISDSVKAASIGALAVAPSNPKVIYAGTGESDIREDFTSGNGVYKSSDGGATWNYIGLEETRQISRIVVDPQNADVVYVGALGHAYAANSERGVFKSVDGGLHWARVLDLGAEIGISDLALCSSSPQLLFAAAWHTHRPPWSGYAPMDGPGSGLYRSGDAGATWVRLQGHGLPDGDWGRVGVDVASDGKRVYALIEVKKEDKKADAAKSGLYRSDDGGNSWALVNADARLTSRAWYFNRITIDPQNPDVVYMPNVAFYRSEDGGKTITVVRGAPGGDDYHQLWIDPKNSASMVLGTDQGTTISLNRGQTWSSWYNQPTAQFYHVTADNQFPYFVYGTQQDSGSAAVASRTDRDSITARDWFPAGGSESGNMVVDPNNPNIIYLTGTYGTVSRFNKRTGFSQDISPWPAFVFDAEINERKYRDPWTPAMVLSPADHTTLYLGTQFVMKTGDGGLHWETISPDLTGATEKTRVARAAGAQVAPTLEDAKRAGYGVVFAIAPSPLDREIIWAGSDTGVIHLTRDGGKNWKDITPPGLGVWSKVSMIEASHFDPAVAYTAVDRSRLDDRTPYIYRTRDYGASWQLIASGIAPSAFLRAVREDPQTKGLLFAGTELGVYASWDDGDHWQSLQLNLPTTGVRDLVIHGDDLVAATFGRSFWILDNISPLRQARKAEANHGGPWLYQPAVAVRVDNDSFSGTPLPPEEPAGQNPPNGAMIDYFLPAAATSVELEIFDAQHKLVRRFSSERHSTKSEDGSSSGQTARKRQLPAVADRWLPKPEVLEKKAGMHRFVWNLTWGSSGDLVADEEAEDHAPAGPKVLPGRYEVQLAVDGQRQKEAAELKVIMDPRSMPMAVELEKQFELAQQIFGESIPAHRALTEMVSVQRQLMAMEQKLASPGSPLKQEFAKARAGVEKILNNKEHVEPEPGMQEAYTGLASALRVVEGGDREIPAQAIAVYHESSPVVKKRTAEWTEFKATTLARLNEQLKEANLAPVAIGE